MAKTKISEYSSTSSINTDINNINIDEGCSPSGINNAIRTLMSHLKDFQIGTSGDSLTVGGSLTVTGSTTFNGDVTATTTAPTENSTKLATTAYVKTNLSALGTMSTQNANSVTITGGSITGATVNASNITNATGWSVTPSGTTLYFNYNGTNVAKLDSSGNLTVKANITAYGTV